MNIFFSEAAQEYLNKHLDLNNLTILVDYVDGDSPYNNEIHGCHCQVYNKYRLIATKPDDHAIKLNKYNRIINTNIGNVLFPSFYEWMFDKNNVFDYNSIYGLYLKSEAGIISESVKLVIT